jgi:hypothetical protein
MVRETVFEYYGVRRFSADLVEEMVDTLRSTWHRDMPFEAIIRLRDDLNGMLQQIRSERQIHSPVFKCPK